MTNEGNVYTIHTLALSHQLLLSGEEKQSPRMGSRNVVLKIGLKIGNYFFRPNLSDLLQRLAAVTAVLEKVPAKDGGEISQAPRQSSE